MLPDISLEEALIAFVVIHILLGISQFLYYPFVKRYIDNQRFPDKSYFVSVIVPVKDASPTLKENLRALCIQDYTNYEVIYASENEDDPGAEVARKLVRESNESGKGTAKQVRYACAGPLGSENTIAKSHNILKGIEMSGGEVLLFTDSDVPHPMNWIQEMVNPLGEVVRGKKISASTAVFFIDPEGFLGIFSSLSSNAAIFLASFTRKHQDLPVYASGASTAVFKDVFHKAGVADEWKRRLNDDLVLASTLIDNGYHIFNVRRLPTRPTERFDSLEGMNNKMVRWMLTVNHYAHPSSHGEIFVHGVRNLQFQVFFDIAIVLFFLGLFGVIEVEMGIVCGLLCVSYIYNVLSRFIIARIIDEKNIYPYLWLSPISQYFWGFYYVITALFFKKFTWGGRVYRFNKRFGKLVKDSRK